MITYGGRVLNTYKTNPVNPISEISQISSMNSVNSVNSVNLVNVYKGGSDTNLGPVNSSPINSNPVNLPTNSVPNSLENSLPSSVPLVHGGGANFDPDLDQFKEKMFEVLKEEPKELLGAMVNAQIRGTMIGQFLGSIAWPLSWVWWVLVIIGTAIFYFILFLIIMFVIDVIQAGLDLVNAAIDGVLIPLKAVYNIKILGARLFGFLGSTVGDLQRTKDEMGETTLDLFVNFARRQMK